MAGGARSGGPIDALVVGAGPAGAACALELARAGRRVVLIDAAAPPRYKTCGGGLVLRARRILEEGLGVCLEGVVERELRVAELCALDLGRSHRIEAQAPLVTMTMRGPLDARLVEAAVAAGAELRAPCRFEALEAHGEGLRARTEQGAIDARWVVAADGATSAVARAAGWPPLRRVAPAIEAELEVDEATLARFADRARFDFGALPHGYAWVFPKRRHLSVGALCARRGARDLRRSLDTWLARLAIEPSAREDHGFLIPAAPRPGPPARGRVLLVGDAAGLADPITFEGIGAALLSGRLAAAAIAGDPGPATAVCRAYVRDLRRELSAELAVARRLAGLVYGGDRLRRLVLGRGGAAACRAMAAQIAGERSYGQLVRHALRPDVLWRALRGGREGRARRQ